MHTDNINSLKKEYKCFNKKKSSIDIHMEWSSVGQSNMHYCQKINFFLWTVWAPSVFGAVWLCRWVVTHSLCRFQLLWPRSCCLHHTEHPFGFSEGWNRYALALLILRTSGWIPHRQNCLPVMAHYESSIQYSSLLFYSFYFK